MTSAKDGAQARLGNGPVMSPLLRMIFLTVGVSVVIGCGQSDGTKWKRADGKVRQKQTGVTAIVTANAESIPVRHDGDAADDACIWVDPDDPAGSLIILTDKRGGLTVTSVDGRVVQYLESIKPNNVDLRQAVTVGEREIDLVVCGDRLDDSLKFFEMDSVERKLVAIGSTKLDFIPVGTCLYRSHPDEKTYAFVTDRDGVVQQWLVAEGEGGVICTLAREIQMETKKTDDGYYCAAEGCVADDERGLLYLAEEDQAIWSFGADPDKWADEGRVVATVGGPSGLAADIEGLALYQCADGTGYLLASSQTHNRFAIFEREPPNVYVGSFTVHGGGGVDIVTHTDGIDVTSRPLGSNYPHGMFICQDDDNGRANQNFKFVSWTEIAMAFEPALAPVKSDDGEPENRAN